MEKKQSAIEMPKQQIHRIKVLATDLKVLATDCKKAYSDAYEYSVKQRGKEISKQEREQLVHNLFSNIIKKTETVAQQPVSDDPLIQNSEDFKNIQTARASSFFMLARAAQEKQIHKIMLKINKRQLSIKNFSKQYDQTIEAYHADKESHNDTLKYYNLAVQSGSIAAMHNLGYLHLVRKEYEKAKLNFTLAKENGDYRADDELSNIKTILQKKNEKNPTTPVELAQRMSVGTIGSWNNEKNGHIAIV
jgi:hypothetical protein